MSEQKQVQVEKKHTSLSLPKEPIQEAVVPTPEIAVPTIDLSKVEEKAQKIVETLNGLVLDVEAQLDILQTHVLELVAEHLEKLKK